MPPALARLRDLSAQDKLEHQRVVKDLDKAHSELKQLQEGRDKLHTELRVSPWMDELSELSYTDPFIDTNRNPRLWWMS